MMSGLERLKKNLGDRGLKRVIEEAIKNINKLKSDEVKKLFNELTTGKLDSGVKEKLGKTDQIQETTEIKKEKQDKTKDESSPQIDKNIKDIGNNNKDNIDNNQINVKEDKNEDGEV